MPDDAAAGESDALTNPRARVKRPAEHGRPVATADLVRERGLHPSGVRVHLERLRRAGLVSREPVFQTRARPRFGWQRASDARPGETRRTPTGCLPAGWRAAFRRARCASAMWSDLDGNLDVSVPVGGDAPADENVGRTLTALGFAPQRNKDNGDACFHTWKLHLPGRAPGEPSGRVCAASGADPGPVGEDTPPQLGS
jgi:DNA-binding transcriptional ArsR family regulator